MKGLNVCLCLLLALGLNACTQSQGQKEDEEPVSLTAEQLEVRDVVLTLFKGMKLGDSAMVHSTFRDDVELYTLFTKEGEPQLRRDGGIQNFLNAVGTPHEVVWNELSWNYRIDIDGPLAQVWCDYAFYADDALSHCGVDAFQLFKSPGGTWKIFVLADTRRKSGCELPAESEIFRP